jgi:hypothetical protein
LTKAGFFGTFYLIIIEPNTMFSEEHGYKQRDTERETGDDTTATADKGNKVELRALSAEDIDTGYDASFEPGLEGQPGPAQTLAEQGPGAFANGLRSQTEPVTEHDLNREIDSYAIDTGEPVSEAQRFQPGESPFEGEVMDPNSPEAKQLENIEELQGEMQKTLEQVSEAMDRGDTKTAIQLTEDLAQKMEQSGGDNLPDEVKAQYADIHATLEQAIKEEDPEKASFLWRLGSGACDFIPIAGPAKMCAEAAYGKTLGGEKLEGWGRALHATEGVVCLVVDCSGGGALLTKGGKGIVVGGKVMIDGAKLVTRSAAGLRKAGAARAIYEPAFKAGTFLARHPELSKATSRGIDYLVSSRKRRLIKDTAKTGATAAYDATIGKVLDRPGAKLDRSAEYALEQHGLHNQMAA